MKYLQSFHKELTKIADDDGLSWKQQMIGTLKAGMESPLELIGKMTIGTVLGGSIGADLGSVGAGVISGLSNGKIPVSKSLLLAKILGGIGGALGGDVGVNHYYDKRGIDLYSGIMPKFNAEAINKYILTQEK